MSVTTPDAQAASVDRSTPLIVVSSDTHIGPRLVEDLRPYCPRRHLPAFDDYADQVRKKREAARNGRIAFGGSAMGGDWKMSTRNLATEGHFDMHARLRDLNDDGVAAEVIFHDSQNGQPIPFQSETLFTRNAEGIDFDLYKVGQHIYNQWLSDVTSIEPERHVGLCHLPMWDIEAAIAELTWAVEVGLKGVNFPAPRPYITPYNFPDWDPFWSACEDLGTALCNHGGAGASTTGGPGAISILKLEIATMSRVTPMDQLIFGGAFERHPELHLVLTESPGAWWPSVMKELDSIFLVDSRIYGADVGERVRRPPSEYAADHVFIGASFHAPFEAQDAVANGYARNVIWGSDYPHFEGTYQYGIASPDGETVGRTAMRFTYAGLPPEEVGWMLGGNAVRAYGLDGDALARVAARIDAPTHDTLNVPVETVPDEGGFMAFRTFGYWS